MPLGYKPSIYEISTQNATNSALQIPYRFLKEGREDSWSFLAFICLPLLYCPILWESLLTLTL